jgi:NDP-sugar pyrophosphorylase family protein
VTAFQSGAGPSIETAVILAGGFGTRLATVVSDVPKPMAPVAGKPFLERLLDRLATAGVRRVVLAVGYKSEVIRHHFGARRGPMEVFYSEEVEPLGTGGAVRLAFESQQVRRAFVLNGDTWCDVDLAALADAHAGAGAVATLTLVQEADASRFGTVRVDAGGRVSGFTEKRPDAGPGLINAGVYVLDSAVFDMAPKTARFSLESDVLQPHAASGAFAAFVAAGARFIDIGVPDDYARAQTLLASA